MQTSINKSQAQQLINHPIFQDACCLPKDLKYALLISQSIHKDEPQMQIVMPYQDRDTTFTALEDKLVTYGIDHKGDRFKIRIPANGDFSKNKYSKEGQVQQTMQSFKKKLGIKQQSRAILPILPENGPYSEARWFPTQDSTKYEICLIVLSQQAEQEEVLTIAMRWTRSIDLLAAIRLKISAKFNMDFKAEDLKISLLKIQLKTQEQACCFQFKNRNPIADQQELASRIFYNPQPVFIAIDIIKPISQKQPIQHFSQKEHLALNKTKECLRTKRALVLQLENHLAFRIYYDEVKAYKIKFLLGIFKVQQSDRKGLMVLGKMFKPDDLVSSFEHAFLHGSDYNFIHAKVSTQKQLFYSCIEDEKHNLTLEDVNSLFDIKAKPQSYCPCLSSYLNQALFPNDHNQRQQLVSQIIQSYIYNYFVEYKIFEQTFWERYIKTMLLELSGFQTYRGWAFRVVNYHYDREINHILQFPNFMVASKREDKVAFKYQIHPEQPKTLFRIKSISGLLVNQVSPFAIDQIIFKPYTCFRIIRKIVKERLIEYELEEVQTIQTISRYNLLVWVDDKTQEGLGIFHSLKKINILYPVYLFQVASNAQLKAVIDKNQKLFDDPNARKIVISNMKRMEEGTIDSKAGVQTYKIVEKRLKHNLKFLFYVGYLQGTIERLRQNKISIDISTIFTDCNRLFQKLTELTNHSDLQKHVNQIRSQAQNEEEDKSQWSGIFSTLKSIKSEGHK